jgi:glycosyltransferase involved in cell wall biosynthesis
MIHVLFFIRDLESGGTQRQILELINGLDKTRFRITLVTFYAGGFFAQELAGDTRVTVISLNKQGRWDNVGFLLRFWRLVREQHPDILHSYLLLPNLFCFLIGKATGTPVVWGLRSALEGVDWTDKLAFRLCALLSRWPDAVIVNSQAGKQYHIRSGYDPRKITVIPNGINTTRFQPDDSARHFLGTLADLPPNSSSIGMVARYDPVKDHPTFFAAAALLLKQRTDVRFICIGSGGAPEYVLKLRQQVAQLGIEEYVLWVEECDDIPAAYNSLDIATLSSVSEGFPNVIGEAMACGVSCVVTDVGDAALIVGDLGVVVPPGNARALAAGWIVALAADPSSMRAQRRQRIVEQFSVQRMVQRTEEVLLRLRRSGPA